MTDAVRDPAPTLEPWLLEVLACPNCRSPLRESVDDATAAAELACTGCGLVYPVRDGIPVLLIDEARSPAESTESPDEARSPAESTGSPDAAGTPTSGEQPDEARRSGA